MRLLDARGLRCPWPALRVARVMRETLPGEKIELIVDDPKAEQEINALCGANGWPIVRMEPRDQLRFTIAR